MASGPLPGLVRRFGVWCLLVACTLDGASTAQVAPRAERLGPEDAFQLNEVLRLQRDYGDRVWPGLGEAAVAFERELEWLEGLAYHVELQIGEQAAADDGAALAESYRAHQLKQRVDFAFRLRRLGSQGGDRRFYLSGAAQAALLDRLAHGWTGDALESGEALEQLLHEAVGAGGAGNPASGEERPPADG